ncbi:diacylglycerol O-acyltransferase 2 isoform X1 [Drosophila teissieri]|uniref:diacylglycerol O-acyltransferase 2 isoform X1 n=2 Tax=Drosophila teissieri TaxID=7243 RepID=UPI001CB9F947|nr:diacylglycerol O-acyltransferase 2 isoform X1 [Drosophila teissieri]
MKIEWAPLRVPLERRIQILVTAFFTSMLLILLSVSFLLVAGSLIYGGLLVRSLMVTYLAYVFVHHKKTQSVVDGNGWMITRTNPLHRHYRDYFPVKLVKTAELPATKNYILASFPHGILGTGIGINMGLEISKWLELFPQVRPKLGTLDQHFHVPFMREVLRCWGLVSVSKEALIRMLSKSNDPKHKDNRDGFTSNAVAILVGGAQEAMDSHPGQYILTLKNRKGFVRMAIRTGSSIVPSFSFGEVDIFDQVANPPSSLLRKFQDFVKKLTGVSPLIPVGRGFFNYTFGFLPFRRRIVQVVGAPIDVVMSDQPDSQYVDKVHGQVIEALEKLFDQYKDKYLENSKSATLVVH